MVVEEEEGDNKDGILLEMVLRLYCLSQTFRGGKNWAHTP